MVKTISEIGGQVQQKQNEGGEATTVLQRAKADKFRVAASAEVNGGVAEVDSSEHRSVFAVLEVPNLILDPIKGGGFSVGLVGKVGVTNVTDTTKFRINNNVRCNAFEPERCEIIDDVMPDSNFQPIPEDTQVVFNSSYNYLTGGAGLSVGLSVLSADSPVDIDILIADMIVGGAIGLDGMPSQFFLQGDTGVGVSLYTENVAAHLRVNAGLQCIGTDICFPIVGGSLGFSWGNSKDVAVW